MNRNQRYCLPVVICCLLNLFANAADYETPPSFEAKKILPANLYKGPNHEVADPVSNDGYLNRYTIKSRFGEFPALGTYQLRIRVTEIDALDQLDRVSRTGVFLEAAKNSALGPVKSVVQFAENPTETVKEIPAGVGRMFKKIGRTAQKGYESIANKNEEKDQTEKESASKKLIEHFFGITDAERKWAQKSGVDPYTSNAVLYKAIHDIAVVDRAGSFTVKLAPIPSIPGLGTMATVYQVAWTKDPYELMNYNKKRLQEMGVRPEVTEQFFKNGFVSPTTQTAMIDVLTELPAVADRSLAIEQSLQLESEIQSNIFLQSLLTLHWYNKDKAPLKRLVTGTRLPAAEGKDSKVRVFFAADHIACTQVISDGISRLNEAYGGFPAGKRELWYQGGISPRCKTQIARSGWAVEPAGISAFD